jgi:hypothetical protein
LRGGSDRYVHVVLNSQWLIPLEELGLPWKGLDQEIANILWFRYGLGWRMKEVVPRLYKRDRQGAHSRAGRKRGEGLAIIRRESNGLDISGCRKEVRNIAAAAFNLPTFTVGKGGDNIIVNQASAAESPFDLKEEAKTVYFINPWNIGSLVLTFLWRHFVDKQTVRQLAEEFYAGDLGAAARSIALQMRIAISKIETGSGKPDLMDDRVRTLQSAVEEGGGRLRWEKWRGKPRPPKQTTPAPTPKPTQPVVSPPPKSCPRCSGAMLYEEDWHGAYSTCISCGYVYEFGATATLDFENEGNREHRQRHRQPSHGKLRL